jgi:hypothetical protein
MAMTNTSPLMVPTRAKTVGTIKRLVHFICYKYLYFSTSSRFVVIAENAGYKSNISGSDWQE